MIATLLALGTTILPYLLGGATLLALFLGFKIKVARDATNAQIDKQATTDGLVRAAAVALRADVDHDLRDGGDDATVGELRRTPRI